MSEPIYVKVVILEDPTQDEAGSYHATTAVEHTAGLDVVTVASILVNVAEGLLEGVEDERGRRTPPVTE
jgi:hypothetical protein